MKTAIKTILLLAALGYLVFALVQFSHPAEDVVCSGLDIVMEDTLETAFITEHEVQNIMAQHKLSPDGMKMGDIDLREIEEKLSSSPYIDTVSCYQTANGKLCIQVTPMHPVLHVMTDDGDEYYLDRTGETMPVGNLNANLCIVTGHFTRKYAANMLAPLGEYLLHDEYWNLQTQQIVVGKKGHVDLYPRVGEFYFHLGLPTNLADKLSRARLFYEQGVVNAGWNRYSEVNVEYSGQVVCKRREIKHVPAPAPDPQPAATPEGENNAAAAAPENKPETQIKKQ